jgi:uncharacterized protein YlbG (UPF0298 family)
MCGSKTKIFLVTYFVFESQHFKKLANLPPQHLSYWFFTYSSKQNRPLTKWGQLAHFSRYNFSHFFYIPKLNITARENSHTLGLKSDLHKLEGVHKEKDGKAFSQNSARIPTCPADGVILRMVRIHAESRRQLFKV